MNVPQNRLLEILAKVKPLAAEYYRLTGKPLGVTGEIAEMAAAYALDLELAPPRTEGYDAIRTLPDGRKERIQIKGRASPTKPKSGQRLSRIKSSAECDRVLLVILNIESLEPREMFEATFQRVKARLHDGIARNSKAAARGSLSISEFKKHCGAEKVWPLQFKHSFN